MAKVNWYMKKIVKDWYFSSRKNEKWYMARMNWRMKKKWYMARMNWCMEKTAEYWGRSHLSQIVVAF